MPLTKNHTSELVTTNERSQKRDCANLLHALEDDNPTARRWAARDLVDCQDASAALVAQLMREDDISVREVILSTLTKVGDEQAVRRLVECLRSEDVALRNQVIDVLKQLPEQVGTIICSLLVDEDADIRIFAVNILESLAHPNVERWLIDVIERDDNVNVCATAVDLLVEVSSKWSEGPLKRLKKRFIDEPYIQFAVDLALKRMADN